MVSIRVLLHFLGVAALLGLWKVVYFFNTVRMGMCLPHMKPPLESTDLTRGLKLFNRAHFFDAHEALEDAWRESPRGSPLHRHLQGLVQLAVAFHHESRTNLVGARSVLDRALRNLNGAEDSFPSLDLVRLRADLAAWQRHLAMNALGSAGNTGKGGGGGLHKRPKLPRISPLHRPRKQS